MSNSIIAAPSPGTLDIKNVSAGNNAPLKTAQLQAKATAAVSAAKNASEYQITKADNASVSKMKIYKPAFSLGIPTERARGSFAAPIQLNYRQADKVSGSADSSAAQNKTQCSTCAQRAYKDGSDDAGVSFQTATSVPASTAGVAVASHEGEHVTRETAKAQEEGRIVTQAKVTFQYACCPECHKMYIAGGTTTISTAADTKAQNGSELYSQAEENEDQEF